MSSTSSTGSGAPALRDLLLLLPPPLFWAGNFIVGRALSDAVPPMALSMLRWIIALAVLLPFALPAMRRDLPLYRANAWRIMGISFCGVFAFNTLVYLGLQSTTASNGLLLNSFIPVLVMLLGAIFYRQAVSARQIIGLVISLAGVMCIVLQGDWRRLLSLSFSQGDLIICAAMLAWSIYTLWLRKIPAEISRIGLMAVQILLALVILIPLSLAEARLGAEIQWSTGTVTALLYLGVFPSVLAYLLYNFAVERLGAAQAGLSIHLMPLFGVLLAVAALGETLYAFHGTGVSLIAAGLVCASWRGAGPA